MESVQHQELRLRDYLRLFRKRIKLILGIFLAVVAMVLAYTFVTPRIYQAKATVQVKAQSTFVIKAAAMSDDSDNLTPTALVELIDSRPYRESADSLLTLAEGYNLDLTARRSQDDMVNLFENDLFKEGLPIYFGRLALQSSKNVPTKNTAFGLTINGKEENNNGADTPQLVRRLSSVEKDEAIKQAGALASLARYAGINIFSLSPEEIGPKAVQIMNSPLIHKLKTDPLNGKRWEDLPPLERGAAVQAAYRQVKKDHPDEADEKAALEEYAAAEIKDTGMLEVSFNSPDPVRSMIGADAMVDTIVWKNQYQRKEEAQKSRIITESMLYGLDGKGGLMGALNESDRKLLDLKIATRVPDIDVVKETRAKNLGELQASYQRAASSATGAERQVRALSQQLVGMKPTLQFSTTSKSEPVGKIKESLALAQAELKSALAKFTEEHPEVQGLRAKVSQLENEARLEDQQRSVATMNEVRQTPNPLYEQLSDGLAKAKADAQSYAAQRDALARSIAQAENEIAQLPKAEFQMKDVNRDQFLQATNLKVLTEKYTEAQINEKTKGSKAQVIELAMEPGKKIKPRRTISLILGMILGLFLGLGAAVFAETLDNRIQTREELDRVLPEVPVLASIPTFLADHPLIVNQQSHSAVTEAFRRLRSAVRFLGLDTPLHSVVVTSPGFKEGKSTVAANLAASLAQSGQRVILVDADLRKPSQHEIMGVDNLSGLSTLLLGDGTVKGELRRTEIEGLSLLPSGPVPPNPAEILYSASMQRLMDELREYTDIVIFDSPPASVVTDAALLGSLADGVLMVVGAGQTSRDSLLRARESLLQARTRLLGSALNRVEVSPLDSQYSTYEVHSTNGVSTNGHHKTEGRVKVKR